MKIEEFIAILHTTEWLPIGHGGFNNAFVSTIEFNINHVNTRWVLKQCIGVNDSSHPIRAVRKFKEIAGLPAYVLSNSLWISPYLGSIAVSDEITADALISIYLYTRNIIVDGCGVGNFLLYDSKAICVDVDYARRRGSVVCDNPHPWNNSYMDNYHDIYSKPHSKPLTVSVIRTLIWLEKYLLPEQIEDSYITLKFFNRLNFVRIVGIKPTVELLHVLFDIPDAIFSEIIPLLGDLKEADHFVSIEKLKSVIIKTSFRLDVLAIVSISTWNLISEDDDNKIFMSNAPLIIGLQKLRWLKIERKKSEDILNISTRVVSKWNAINPSNKAIELNNDICLLPYLGDIPAHDEIIAKEVLRIYLETRNLIINACEPDTFILHSGKAVCVRVNYARCMDLIDSPIEILRDARRINDRLSFWSEHPTHSKPITASLIRQLDYIEEFLLPHQIKNEYLTSNILINLGFFLNFKMPLNVNLMNIMVDIPDEILKKLICKLDILQDKFRLNISLEATKALERIHVLFNFKINLSDDLVDRIMSMSEDVFHRLVYKLSYLKDNVEGNVANDEIYSLLDLLEFDVDDDIPDHYLLDFLELPRMSSALHEIMHLAAYLCLLPVIRTLLAYNSSLLDVKDPISNKTPLMVSILSRNKNRVQQTEVIKYFIIRDAELNNQIKSKGISNLHGYTALDCANRYNLVEIADLLKKVGALSRTDLSDSELSVAISSTRRAVSNLEPTVSQIPRLDAFKLSGRSNLGIFSRGLRRDLGSTEPFGSVFVV